MSDVPRRRVIFPEQLSNPAARERGEEIARRIMSSPAGPHMALLYGAAAATDPSGSLLAADIQGSQAVIPFGEAVVQVADTVSQADASAFFRIPRQVPASVLPEDLSSRGQVAYARVGLLTAALQHPDLTDDEKFVIATKYLDVAVDDAASRESWVQPRRSIILDAPPPGPGATPPEFGR